jgi:DNA-binding SARP family transcriptional activator/predicted negative regulator of RcsB-dependent stress response
MRFGVLGSLLVQDEAGGVRSVAGVRQRILLAALLMRANQVVSAGELAEIVWDGAPPAGGAALRTQVMRLRHALGSEVTARIATRDPGYVITLGEQELDSTLFEAWCREAGAAVRAERWREAAGVSSRALGLWRGEVLVDVDSRVLREEYAVRLEQMRMQAVEWRVDGEMHLGRHDQLVPELRDLAQRYPLRERVHAQLMLALYRCGRQAEALEAYRDARRILVEELGIEPGAPLRELHHKILAGDPALVAPPPGQDDGVEPAAAGRVVAPQQLPAGIPHFTGRADELEALTTLADRARGFGGAVVISAIAGTAGIGKTALAVHWGQQAADRFPDGRLYANLRGFDPTGVPVETTAAIRGFLDGLGVPVDRIPAGLEEQISLYRSLLVDQRALVVLDNARDADQVRPLLPGGPNCLVLVTSRNQLIGLVAVEGAQPLTLDLLHLDEARELLAHRLGAERVAREPAAADELIRLCARLPLALNIAAARAALRPGYPLGRLVEELSDGHDRLAGLDTGDSTANVRAVFWWSYRTLDPSAARMFRLLGVHAGPDITVPAAASLAATSRDQARGALHELARAHLLSEHQPGRFSFHDLLRAYAVEQTNTHDTEAERRQALHRALDHYLHTAYSADRILAPTREPITPNPPQSGTTPESLTDDQQAWVWLEAEYPVLQAAITQAATLEFDTHAYQLPWILKTFLDRRGRWHDLAAVQTTAVAAARHAGDRSEQARAYRFLGLAHTRLASYQDAQTHFEQALKLYRLLGDHVGQAHSHHGLTWVSEQRGDYREALDHARQALNLHRAAGHQVGQANALNMVGWYHSLLGNHQLTLNYCQQALDLNQRLGNYEGEAAASDSLGHAHHHLGHHEHAITCYRHTLDLHRKIGERYQQAITLVRLGDTHLAIGDHESARDCWEQALAILDDLRHPEADQVRVKLNALP